jgi:D-alanyl-D-alanine endopeptidase (penicillin-binding protein 7)
VKDLDTGEIITQKNTEEIRSIASITKLMTAIVVLDAKQDLSENIVYKRPSGLRSRLPNGITLKRSEIMLLALMSSDNVAATLLAENYPGGVDAAIGAMNIKAHQLGMLNSHFTDPTGLLSDNVSTAEDLTKLVDAAYKHDVIREYSTKSAERVSVTGKKKPYFVDFHTTNSLVTTNAGIALSKTGWIQKSGGCLVMIVKNQGQRLAVILLNSRNTHTRIRDGLLLTEYNNVRNQRNFR